MGSIIERKTLDGEVLYREMIEDEPCSVEVGFTAKGELQVKAVKLYFGAASDIPAIEAKAAEAVEAAVRRAQREIDFREQESERIVQGFAWHLIPADERSLRCDHTNNGGCQDLAAWVTAVGTMEVRLCGTHASEALLAGEGR